MLVRLFSSPGFHHPAVLQGRRRLFADGHNPHISVRAELEILGGFIVRLAVGEINPPGIQHFLFAVFVRI
jgi:hypothetical protein